MEKPSQFLEHLIGEWELEGQMGEIPLRQSVKGKWVLSSLFVELHFRSTLPAPNGQKLYEAIYYLGYHEKRDVYVLHLFDTTGVAWPYLAGVGRRQDDALSFLFEDKEAPFTNKFVYDPARDEWRFELTYVQDGLVHNFATKRMVRAQGTHPADRSIAE